MTARGAKGLEGAQYHQMPSAGEAAMLCPRWVNLHRT